MKVIIKEDNVQGGKAAFEIFEKAIKSGAKNFGLATGSTPETLYKNWVASDLDCSELTSINLDEYVGLKPEDPQSYHYFMQKHLFDQKPFKKTYVPDGLAEDIDAYCKEYDQLIEDNQIDVQLLGIGQNGHIAFNEPGTPFNTGTHEVKLTENTIKANSRFFDSIDDVPKSAICMGTKNIMHAKKIVLLAFGKEKAHAIKMMIDGPVTEEVPASILQLHPDVTVIVDKDAASEL
ncbi:glucosamine-6-phosphate isomerase [Lactobacillus pasteurii DSM 23907 = CRBIP 24.76]|uniref:Glucosamine-6-phosphate deaminase n=1 Tax=Lactobacillus pasteurii DSM 23907 = CRBIP 24.76 TaxID=1423790 RepID=I7KL19_9LACO|nr:glucosamine-6-phosphate deaminase [Lactobacillus pasteurii]KRK07269.1 glucosamine-6-phosphate isomerase [Lactobacillus pasteurii DSM 23907 = CRBIP 24.76]TDG78416.1 hypothetical protein C5L33_001014 [Lactobacillus pasteurii]CCI84999.1 Glucosamine-6-phosphate deaminase [Lactobacillus pasteurii DSM 23907 = CRBIP 24.76]